MVGCNDVVDVMPHPLRGKLGHHVHAGMSLLPFGNHISSHESAGYACLMLKVVSTTQHGSKTYCDNLDGVACHVQKGMNCADCQLRITSVIALHDAHALYKILDVLHGRHLSIESSG